MRTYTKPALTFQQQVEQLKDRGLQIDDENRAVRHLSNISYYRLSAYMLPLKKQDQENTFKEGSSWNDVYDLYRFDRKFRLLIFDAIERIEIALRTQIIYQLSHKYGSHWQDNNDIFKQIHYTDKTTGEKKTYNLFDELQRHIADLLKNNNQVEFIAHYLNTYSHPRTPPSWMCLELLYFSELSKICKYLKNRRDTTDVASYFGCPPDEFCSWLHAINYVRNICAHHARLWDIRLSVKPKKFYYKGADKIWLAKEEIDRIQSSKVYYFICVILYLLQTINPHSKFKQHFFKLLEDYPFIDVGQMGFPREWREHPLWR